MVTGSILVISLINICSDPTGTWLTDIMVRRLVNISGNVWSYMVTPGADYPVQGGNRYNLCPHSESPRLRLCKHIYFQYITLKIRIRDYRLQRVIGEANDHRPGIISQAEKSGKLLYLCVSVVRQYIPKLHTERKLVWNSRIISNKGQVI